MVFEQVFNMFYWSSVKFEGRQSFDETLLIKQFILFSCLVSAVLRIWTAADKADARKSLAP